MFFFCSIDVLTTRVKSLSLSREREASVLGVSVPSGHINPKDFISRISLCTYRTINKNTIVNPLFQEHVLLRGKEKIDRK